MAAVTTSPTAPEHIGVIAQMAASHPSGAATGFQASTFGFGAVVTTATRWGPDTAACTTSEDWNHCDRNFAAEFASRESVTGFSDTAGPWTSGLGYGVVFLVCHNKSCAGCVVSILAAGMEGGEHYDFSLCGSGASPGGKRRLIRGGGSAAQISNGTGLQDPGGGKARLTASRDTAYTPIGSRMFG